MFSLSGGLPAGADDNRYFKERSEHCQMGRGSDTFDETVFLCACPASQFL